MIGLFERAREAMSGRKTYAASIALLVYVGYSYLAGAELDPEILAVLGGVGLWSLRAAVGKAEAAAEGG